MLKFSLRVFFVLLMLSVFPVHGQSTRVVVIPLFGDDAPVPIVYAIGGTGPAGGKVFYVTNGGLNGLEAAPVDQGSAPWNCFGTDVVGVDNVLPSATDSNSGSVNTPLIAVQCPRSVGVEPSETNATVLAAVYVWPNGQTDGFLPNKEELNLLYAQKDVVGGFAGIYWSSSESSGFDAWDQVFNNNGAQVESVKTISNRVRAVRAF